MQPTDESPQGQGNTDQIGEEDRFYPRQRLLTRVRTVAQQITERVRKTLGSDADQPSGPNDQPSAPA